MCAWQEALIGYVLALACGSIREATYGSQADDGYALSTIEQRVSGVRRFYARGYFETTNPANDAKVAAVMKDLARLTGKQPRRRMAAQPMAALPLAPPLPAPAAYCVDVD